MIPAPLAFLRQRLSHRSRITDREGFTSIDVDGKESFRIEFFQGHTQGEPSSAQTFPPNQQGRSSYFHPPTHYHLLQDEHFRVTSGAGIWHMWDGRDVHVCAGERISVPSRKRHSFNNDPESTEPMRVEYWYDREYIEMEDRFFRNQLGYLADCITQGVEPSILQFCVFAAWNLMPLGLVQWSFLPHDALFVVNTLLTVLGAFTGQVLLGYKRSYPEYWTPAPKKAE